MAWVLDKEDSSTQYRLLANTDHVVGRKGGRLVLGNDASISRAHATFSISFSESDVCKHTTRPLAMLKDSSKYGTTVNGGKVDKDGVILNSGDKIHFGVFDNKWRITYKPFMCSSSCLDSNDKVNVRQQLAKIGGHLVNDWRPSCSFLIMNKLGVTLKVINALVSQRSVVTSNYLTSLVDAVAQDADDPEPQRYVPQLSERILIEAGADSLTPNVKRSSLFKDKRFVTFTTKQFKKLEFAIKAAGGSLFLFDGNVGKCVEMLRDNNTHILQDSKDGSNKDFITCQGELNRQRKRAILEAEIGLSIIFCSTEKYCNPEYLKALMEDDELESITTDASQLTNCSSQMDSQMLSLGTSRISAIGTKVNSLLLEGSMATDCSSLQLECSLSKSGIETGLPLAKDQNPQKSMDCNEPFQAAAAAPPVESREIAQTSKSIMPQKHKQDDILLRNSAPKSKRCCVAVEESEEMFSFEELPQPDTRRKEKSVPLPNVSEHVSASKGEIRPLTVTNIPREFLSSKKLAPVIAPEGELRPSAVTNIPMGFLSSKKLSPPRRPIHDDAEICQKPLMRVDLVPLRKSACPPEAEKCIFDRGDNIKNFKAFKKVYHKYEIRQDNGYHNNRQREIDPLVNREVGPPTNNATINGNAQHNVDFVSARQQRKNVPKPNISTSTREKTQHDDDSDDGANAFDW